MLHHTADIKGNEAGASVNRVPKQEFGHQHNREVISGQPLIGVFFATAYATFDYFFDMPHIHLITAESFFDTAYDVFWQLL